MIGAPRQKPTGDDCMESFSFHSLSFSQRPQRAKRSSATGRPESRLPLAPPSLPRALLAVRSFLYETLLFMRRLQIVVFETQTKKNQRVNTNQWKAVGGDLEIGGWFGGEAVSWVRNWPACFFFGSLKWDHAALVWHHRPREILQMTAGEKMLVSIWMVSILMWSESFESLHKWKKERILGLFPSSDSSR